MINDLSTSGPEPQLFPIGHSKFLVLLALSASTISSSKLFSFLTTFKLLPDITIIITFMGEALNPLGSPSVGMGGNQIQTKEREERGRTNSLYNELLNGIKGHCWRGDLSKLFAHFENIPIALSAL